MKNTLIISLAALTAGLVGGCQSGPTATEQAAQVKAFKGGPMPDSFRKQFMAGRQASQASIATNAQKAAQAAAAGKA
jgi:hypothetical protein